MAFWDRWLMRQDADKVARHKTSAETLQQIEARHTEILRGQRFAEILVEILSGHAPARPKERSRER